MDPERQAVGPPEGSSGVPTDDTSSASAGNATLTSGAVAAATNDEALALKFLTENVRDQDDLERDITLQASRALIEAEDKRDQKRIEKAELTRSRLENQLKLQQQKLRSGHSNPTARLRTQREIARIEAEIEICDKDIADFNARIEHGTGATSDEIRSPIAVGLWLERRR